MVIELWKNPEAKIHPLSIWNMYLAICLPGAYYQMQLNTFRPLCLLSDCVGPKNDGLFPVYLYCCLTIHLSGVL